jgi:hypothetical protein
MAQKASARKKRFGKDPLTAKPAPVKINPTR